MFVLSLTKYLFCRVFMFLSIKDTKYQISKKYPPHMQMIMMVVQIVDNLESMITWHESQRSFE